MTKNKMHSDKLKMKDTEGCLCWTHANRELHDTASPPKSEAPEAPKYLRAWAPDQSIH